MSRPGALEAEWIQSSTAGEPVAAPELRRLTDIGGTEARVLVCLLGSFRVLRGRDPIPLRTGSKTEQLLSYLALRGRQGATRESLLSSFWADADPLLAGQSLNSLVYSLGRLLGPALGGAPPVVRPHGVYCLNFAAGVCLDVDEFDVLAARGDRLARNGDLSGAARAYTLAAALYRGDLSVGSDVHSVVERERLRALYLSLLAALAEHYFVRADYDACMRRASAILAVDPCREDAHRLVMRCYVRRGERAQALRQYRLCESMLRTEFDATPEPLTTALFDRIRLDPSTA